VKLDGKVALVTGGAVRIGREIALALAARGVRVALHYRESASAAAETAVLIRDRGGDVELFQADLRDAGQADPLVAGAAERFGRLDILVNSAALFLPGNLEQTTEENWNAHFDVNLKAPFFLCQAFARYVGKGGGAVVNIADWRAVYPGPDYLAYTLSKSGLVTLTTSLAQALAPAVRVNACRHRGKMQTISHGWRSGSLCGKAAPLMRWSGHSVICWRRTLSPARCYLLTGGNVSPATGSDGNCTTRWP
jgi:pteridine reductase